MDIKEKSYENEKGETRDDKSEDKNKKIPHIKKMMNGEDKNDFLKYRQKSASPERGSQESKNKTLRCLICFSISFLLLNQSTHTVKINCNQGHNISIDIKDYLEKGFMNNFYNQICSQCKSKISILSESKNYYCHECNEIFCRTCIKNHNLIFNNN